jgi:hypothetical protein
MKKFISRNNIIYYIILIALFKIIFHGLTPCYAYPTGPTPNPIDTRVIDSGHFFDSHYVIAAKQSGYNIPCYYQTFLVLDLIFPLIYTFFLFSMLQFVKEKRVYTTLKYLSIAGFAFDWLEDLSFALFLKLPGNALAPFVAACTTFKTILFLTNILVVICITAWLIIKQFNKPKQRIANHKTD